MSLSAPAPGAELRRGDDALNITLQTEGSLASAATFGGRANIAASADGFSLGIGASALLGQSGPQVGQGLLAPLAGPSSRWRSTDLSASARWSTPVLQVGIEAAQKLNWAERAEQLLPMSAGRYHASIRDETIAGLNANLRLTERAMLQVTTRARRWWQSAEAVGGDRSGYGGEEDNLSLATKWRLSGTVTVDVGALVSRNTLAWRGDQSVAHDAASLQPRVALQTSKGRMRLRLSAERAVSPLALDHLRSAEAAEPGTASLRPPEEWRIQAEVERRIGNLFTLSAQLGFAEQADAIELSATSAGNVRPVNVAAGARQQASIGVSASLDRLGFAGAKLAGRGAWRRSQVVDPITGDVRPGSGERPYEGRLEFSQAVPDVPVTWGLDAYVTGSARYYRPSEIMHLDAVTGLGGYIDYAPGPLRLQMRVDNLLGGDRRSTTEYFRGTRASGGPIQIGQALDPGKRLMISLSRQI